MANDAFALTPEQIELFERNGYFGPFEVYDPAETKERVRQIRIDLLDRSSAAYALEDQGKAALSIANYDRHLDLKLLGEHICRPQIVHKLRSVIGDDLLCWRTEFFPKPPGAEGTPWHQNDTFSAASGHDQLVWPEELRKTKGRGGTITVWCAFTESTIENGCLKLMPGTQHMRYYDEKRGFKSARPVAGFGYDFKEIQFDPSWKPDEDAAFKLVMRPGQCVMFWSTLLHGALPNKSRTFRLGFAARYVPTDVKIYPETEMVEEFGSKISLDKWGAVLVSGEDRFGHNKVITKNLRGEPYPKCP